MTAFPGNMISDCHLNPHAINDDKDQIKPQKAIYE